MKNSEHLLLCSQTIEEELDEFNKQYQHQSIKKHHIQKLDNSMHVFGANKVVFARNL
jgi:hypothetical protein